MQRNELRKEVRFCKELLSLIETLKNVAGSQYHLMEKEKERFDRFMDAFSGFFRVVNLVEVENPLVRVQSDVLGLIVVTSDAGFMGGLNQGVVRAAFAARESLGAEKISLVIVGEKGVGILSERHSDYKFFQGISQGTLYEQALEIKDYLVKEVLAGRMGRVMVAYPKPISFSAQTIEVIGLLPCGELFDKGAPSEIESRWAGKGLLRDARKVIVESSFSDMVEYLSSVWVASKLYEVFEDSKLAEFSARAMHLEGSQQKVEKNYKKLKHQYFKSSHELIDKGMRESYAAKGGLKRKKKKSAEAA